MDTSSPPDPTPTPDPTPPDHASAAPPPPGPASAPGPAPTAAPTGRNWPIKWYYLVIAGIVVFCLLCSCVGAGAYLLLRDDSSSGLALADPTAGCEEAILGAPADTTGEAASPELNRRWAEHFRKAAEKANRPEIRSAILDEAAAWDHVADVQEEVDAKERAGTVEIEDTLALSRALREQLAAHRQVMDVCAEAGYE